ncbi:hypothetical protein RchiOBHm_Chr4g0445511 [Rosa chinensis]|uniref:Uncharacterized protein n=1 Tax=Rosa chinensis TaxID=74649 RepID=A0A2P6R4E3_ROSCH|nr:hypothetical protein RchiOBHm_Chr4g0445511 [Rosa chinensis]
MATTVVCNSSVPGPPPPRAVATAIHGGASAMVAHRWIPKRGQVLRKVLKTVFSCVCIKKEASSVYPVVN